MTRLTKPNLIIKLCVVMITLCSHTLLQGAEIKLAGKTINHQWTKGEWAGSTFVTYFCNETELVWNNTTNPDKISSARNAYVLREIADGVVQITWKESPKTGNYGLVWTINFQTEINYGVIVNASPTENVVVEGEFQLFDSIIVKKGLSGCN